MGLHIGEVKQIYEQFVEDMMFMGHLSIQGERDLNKGITMFSRSSGLEINYEKSHIFFFNTPRITRRKLYSF